MTNNFRDEVEEFLKRTGMSAYRLGWLAVKNGRFVERLRAGRRFWPETEVEVRAFMRMADKEQRKTQQVKDGV